jgi:hypothetical protein
MCEAAFKLFKKKGYQKLSKDKRNSFASRGDNRNIQNVVSHFPTEKKKKTNQDRQKKESIRH